MAHEIQRCLYNEHSNYNDAINESQGSMNRNNQHLHQENELNHNCNNHKFNNNKNNKSRLSLEDEIYLIFYQNGNKSLFLDKIQQELFYKFGRNHIDYSDIKKIRFLYIMQDESLKMHIKLDDICRNGFNCKIKRGGKCQRIHAIIKRHICFKLLNFKTMTCYDNNCESIHYPPNRLTNIILELILFIYNKHEKYNKSLQHFRISDREFIATYHQFYSCPPIPNITHSNWKRIIDRYSRYYYDYQQQSDDPANNRSFIFLWKVNFDDIDIKMGSWHIKIKHNPPFFEERTCHNNTFNSINNKKYIKCHFIQSYFCPYFHLSAKFVSVNGHCKDCIYGKTRCDRFHFDNQDYLKTSYPLPATCWTRPIQQLNTEINDIMYGHDENTNIITMNETDIARHNKWCNKLDFEFNRHQNRHKNNPIFYNDDILQNGYIDSLIDHGFHEKHDGINIFWDSSKMRGLNELEIVYGLFRIFYYQNNQNITDIELPGIEKIIILKYKVEVFQNIFIKMAHSFQRLGKQWCFNRRISFKVKYDGFYMIFEFSNINTFLSVKSMKEWFHSFITNYDEFFGEKLLSFHSGSYHFVHHQPSISVSHNATAYFYGIHLNPNDLINTKINGVSIKLSQPLHHAVWSKNIHNWHTKFVNYGDPKIYSYLSDNDKLYLHEQQSNGIKLNNINIVEKIDRRQTVQTVQCSRNSPPPNDYKNNKNDNINNNNNNNDNQIEAVCCNDQIENNANIVQFTQERVQTVQQYDEYESSSNSPPPNNYKNNNIKGNDNDKRMQRVENKQDNERINNDEVKNAKYQYRVCQYDESCYMQSKVTQTITTECCNNHVIGNRNVQISNQNNNGNVAKDDGVSNEYCNLTKILEIKHKQCGNANEENKDKQFFSVQSMNELCRYCLMAIYSEQHKEECFFIPQWVKEGRSEPFDKIKDFMVFNGHHYLQKH